jgi:hypothetical protein
MGKVIDRINLCKGGLLGKTIRENIFTGCQQADDLD